MNVVRPPTETALGQAREVLALLGDNASLKAKFAELSAAVDTFTREQKEAVTARAELADASGKLLEQRKELVGVERREAQVQSERESLHVETTRLKQLRQKLGEEKAGLAEGKTQLRLATAQLARDSDVVSAAKRRVEVRVVEVGRVVADMKRLISQVQ